MNLANKISITRILLVPFFIAAVLYSKFELALLFFTVAVLTDAADGYIARKFNQKTKLGTMLDPVADKVLIISAFICLVFVKNLPFKVDFPLYVPIVVISRDVIILIGSLIIIALKGNIDVKPSIAGKITTFFQMSTVIAVLVKFPYSHFIWNIMVIFTLFSGAEYVIKGSKQLNG